MMKLQNNFIAWMHHKSVGLLILRVFVGVIFLIHGIQKWINLEPMTVFFGQIGLNAFWLYVVAVVETLGGVLLILGLFTRYAAILLSVVMVSAIVLFKWKIGGETWLGKFAAAEIDLALLGANLAMIFTGAGSLALWRVCKHKCHGTDENCGVCDAVGCEHKSSASSASSVTTQM